MIEALFVITGAYSLLALFKLVGLVFGNGMSLPYAIPFTSITPTNSWIITPSFGFQIWFWGNYAGLFATVSG